MPGLVYLWSDDSDHRAPGTYEVLHTVSPEETEYCKKFIGKWREKLSTALGTMLLRAKYGRATPTERKNALWSLLLAAPELEKVSQEVKQSIFDEAYGAIEVVLGGKK